MSTDIQVIDELRKEGHKVRAICQTLQVPVSSYYRCCKPQDDRPQKAESGEYASLLGKIKDIKKAHPAWGYRRVTAVLRKASGSPVNRKRVYRLMRLNDLLADVRQHKASRTPQKAKPRPTRKNEWWGTDMTCFHLDSVGWVYVVGVLDWFNKKLVGHSIGLRPTTALWQEALDMAVLNECPNGSRTYGIHLMSDNGSQPTSKAYEKACVTLGIDHVTTSYSNPKGNADTERFFRTLKEDTIWPFDFKSYSQAVQIITDWFEYYNAEYPHSALGYLSPSEFEQIRCRQAA